jgi:transposase
MPYDDVTPAGGVRRIEVFTGTGPRRRWSPEEKARIVAESYAGVGTVCDVARRHGLAPTQLFTWRREARLPREARSAPTFAPVVIEAPALPVVAAPRVEPRSKKVRRARQGGIELEIDGVVMRVSRGAEAKTVAAVIKALKAER